MRLLIYLILICMLSGCSPNGRKDLDDQSVWTVSRHDDPENKNFGKIKVRFHSNGYAYEENTILKYPYHVFHLRNTFEFNRKLYRILEWTDKEIVLQNSSTDIVIILHRE